MLARRPDESQAHCRPRHPTVLARRRLRRRILLVLLTIIVLTPLFVRWDVSTSMAPAGMAPGPTIQPSRADSHVK